MRRKWIRFDMSPESQIHQNIDLRSIGMQVLRLNEEFQDEEIREGYKEIRKMKSTMYATLQESVASGKSLRTAVRVAVVVMDVLLSVSKD